MFTGCDYTERFAGGELNGEVLPTPNDWSFSDSTMLVQLEANPKKPYSVNIWGVGMAVITTWLQVKHPKQIGRITSNGIAQSGYESKKAFTCSMPIG